MLKLLTAGLICVAISFAIFAEDVKPEPVVSKPLPEEYSKKTNPQVAEQLSAEIKQLLDLLKQNNKLFKPEPVLSNKFDILNMIAKEVSPLLEVSETPFANAPEINKTNAEIYPIFALSDIEAIYIRLDYINASTIAPLIDFATLGKDKRENAKACIFDLRKCSGGDVGSMLKVLGMSIKESAIVNFRLADNQIFAVLKFVLIGPETSGTGELLAASLKKAKDVVIIGENTAGRPFAYKQFKLESGTYVNIPQLPQCMKRISQFPVKPEVLSSPRPQTAYTVLKSSGNYKKDSCLTTVVDLFKALQVTRDI
ncbi:MAG: hypothetical protein GY750_20535 [Lentisphaerae bacterium]|nr:hypothetical protein [Lentisphaerota bacterium]MCP4103780.1 hypothetical protein [Lentisphaerota bacterium]